MAFGPPDESDLASIGERYGLELSSADVASFLPFATGLLSSWTAVEDLYRAPRQIRGTTVRGRVPPTRPTRSAPGT